jgi:beta-phosphoglucomutase
MLMAVIFDMDGVIVDSHAAHIRTWKKLFWSLGKCLSDADLDFVRQGIKRQEILRHFLGELKDKQIQAYCREKDLLFQSEIENIRLIPGAQALLEDLKCAGVPTALASCGSTARVYDLLSHLRLRDYFASVVTGDEVAIGKPHPEIFHKAAAQLRVHPAESLVFEDSISGVQAAKAAGMKCIGIGDRRHGSALLQAGADQVLPDLAGTSWIKIQKLLARSGKQRHETCAYIAFI